MAWWKHPPAEMYDPFDDEGMHLVSGGALNGADALAEAFARQKGLPITIHHAKWMMEDGNKDVLAGFARNTRIAEDSEVLLAFWDGKSTGTIDTCKKMLKLGRPTWVIKPDGSVHRGIDLIHPNMRHHYPRWE